jgi:hypothetical protein
MTADNTKRLTQKSVAPIKAMVKKLFAERGIEVHTIYRTCSIAFGNSLGGDCPGNLLLKPTVPSRVTISLDFNDRDVHLDNFRRIIAFPESVADKLPRYPKWRPDVDKVNLEAMPSKYVFRDWDDLKTNYQRIFDA